MLEKVRVYDIFEDFARDAEQADGSVVVELGEWFTGFWDWCIFAVFQGVRKWDFCIHALMM